MFIDARFGFFLLISSLSFTAASAQQPSPPAQPVPDLVYLDVVVTPKSGPPVSGLQQQDFTVLDNKTPMALTSFQAFNGAQAPIHVIIVVDDVNTGVNNIAYERSEIDKFLRADAGHLAHPTAFAFLTDAGLQVQDEFSMDGNALSASLDKYDVGLHSIARGAGIYGAAERFQISLDALMQLTSRESGLPGRKIVLWVSPGWTLFSSPAVQQQLGSTQEAQIFRDIVRFSTLLRQASITLYSIDPLGTSDFGGRSFRWEMYVKGVSKPTQADPGDLALQVLATQSGGLAFTTGNDIASFFKQCLADTQAYYELSFAPSLDQKRDEYHHLEVHVDKPGLIARTRQGYYSNP